MKDRIIEIQKEVIREYASMDFGCMCAECKETRKRLLKLKTELQVLEQGNEESILKEEKQWLANHMPSYKSKKEEDLGSYKK